MHPKSAARRKSLTKRRAVQPVNKRATPNGTISKVSDRGFTNLAEGRRALLNAQGGCVSVTEACRLFRKGRPVPERTLVAAIRSGTVIAYHKGGGHYAVPVWQFHRKGSLLDGLPEILGALRSMVPGYGQLTPFAFFLQADPVTGGGTPLAALREAQTKKVMEAVRARTC